MSVINREVNFVLKWSENCVATYKTKQAAQNNNPAIYAQAEKEFKITTAKLYAIIIILTNLDNAKLLKLLKCGFKSFVSWNRNIVKRYK